MMRRAISPRLAMRMRRNMSGRPDQEELLPELHRVTVVDQHPLDGAVHLGLEVQFGKLVLNHEANEFFELADVDHGVVPSDTETPRRSDAVSKGMQAGRVPRPICVTALLRYCVAAYSVAQCRSLGSVHRL